jgi:hypothetical protein
VKFLDRGHIAPVARHRPFQRGGGRSRRREQRFDKAPGLGSIKLNQIALIDDLAGGFTRVQGDEFGERAALKCGGFTEKLFVRRGYPGDEALAFRFFQCRRHAPNVCLRGTQIKN